MKKFLSCLFILATVAVFCACSTNTSGSIPTAAITPSPTPDVITTPSPTPVPELYKAEVKVSSVLNVRENPSTDAKIVSALPNKTEVSVFSEENGWCYIEAVVVKDGVQSVVKGYCSRNFLFRTTATPTATNPTFATNPPSADATPDNFNFGYTNLPTPYPKDATTTAEMLESADADIAICKAKLAQLVSKVKAYAQQHPNDQEIQTAKDKIVASQAHWEEHALIELEYKWEIYANIESWGTNFSLAKSSDILSTYEARLAYMEETYKIYIGAASYFKG
ncbi:MAG: SH3 domain-containing protein [Clostridia bacterium]|nr:SH3 domain-containing protein [Clostridia bacterium]